jgi:hypothetical protein
MHKIGIDSAEIDRNSKNYRYLIIGINCFTRWVEAKAVSNMSKITVMNFIENWIIKQGCPEIIFIDNYKTLVSKLVDLFYKKWDIR